MHVERERKRERERERERERQLITELDNMKHVNTKSSQGNRDFKTGLDHKTQTNTTARESILYSPPQDKPCQYNSN